jgi:hypothetical protein
MRRTLGKKQIWPNMDTGSKRALERRILQCQKRDKVVSFSLSACRLKAGTELRVNLCRLARHGMNFRFPGKPSRKVQKSENRVDMIRQPASELSHRSRAAIKGTTFDRTCRQLV